MVKTLTAVMMVFLLAGCETILFEGGRRAINQGDIALEKRKAAKGDVQAQYKVGKILCCGRPSGRDIKQSLHWFCLAAKRGQRDAMFEVANIFAGVYHEPGSPIAQDKVLSMAYYQLAADRGDASAARYGQLLMSRLSDQEINEAERFVALYPAIPCDVTL